MLSVILKSFYDECSSLLLFDEQWSWSFLSKAELALFKLRMSLLTNKELVKSLRRLDRDSKSFVQLSGDFADTLAEVRRYGFVRFVEALRTPTDSPFPISCLLVPFTAVLEPVSRRTVRLQRGLAFVTANCFDHVLTFLFASCMEMRRNCFDLYCSLKLDERLLFIASEVKAFIKSACPELNGVGRAPGGTFLLSSEAVDELQVMFPPCMLYLHKQLRLNHRLRHHARVLYTLFLKDIGMTAEESLNFWSAEFGIPCKGSSSGCSHSWSADKRRYTYNILHLHGLVGSRRKYSCRSCESLQNDLTFLVNDCGCPFRCFDDEKLQEFLLASYPLHFNLITYILRERAEGHYNSSCLLVRQAISASKVSPPSVLPATQPVNGSVSCSNFSPKFSGSCSLPNESFFSDCGESVRSSYSKVNSPKSSLDFASPVNFFTALLNSVNLGDPDAHACASR